MSRDSDLQYRKQLALDELARLKKQIQAAKALLVPAENVDTLIAQVTRVEKPS